MLTKGIVEELINKYTIRVRLPVYNKSASSISATPTKELSIASVCFLPNCDPSIQIGDIVFVGFEDNDINKPVILGHLYKSNKGTTYSDMIFNSLNVQVNCALPSDTTIGNIQPQELQAIKGISDNIQSQLNQLSQRVANLENV